MKIKIKIKIAVYKQTYHYATMLQFVFCASFRSTLYNISMAKCLLTNNINVGAHCKKPIEVKSKNGREFQFYDCFMENEDNSV